MDVFHVYGADLALGATGDLALAAPPVLTQQRVLRRLLTNAGDYIFQPAYGAGLAQFVGATLNPTQIQAVIRGQIFAEAAVAAAPLPVVDVSAAAGGSAFVELRYTDAATAQTQVLSFGLGA